MVKKTMLWSLIIIGFQLPFFIYSVSSENENNIVNTISFFVLVGVFTYFIRKEIIENISLPKVEFVKTAAMTGIYLGLLDGLLTYLYYNSLRTDVLKKQIDVTQKVYEDLKYTQEEITQMVENLSMVLQSPLYHIFLSSFMWISVFSLTALLYSFFLKKQYN